MLPQETVRSFCQWVGTSLTAHLDELADEIKTTEKSTAKATFELQVRSIGGGKHIVKVKARFPRSASTEEDRLADVQLQLPGM